MQVPFEIDYVFPWVNDHDPVWRETFIKYCKEHGLTSKIDELEKERYRDWGLLKYVFRGIAKNMPWIRKVHLLVSNVEQIPLWINTFNVNIVLHREFIPTQFLPTFNSTAIEMFLPQIPDLAEHFIYGNDDMFMFNPSEPSDWFTPEGKPRFNMRWIKKSMIKGEQFRVVCAKQWWTMEELLGHGINLNGFRRPWHGANPMVKSYCNEVLDLFGDRIEKSISPFRESYNMNQYIYTNYCYSTGKSETSTLTFEYAGVKTAKSVLDAIMRSTAQTLCINDCSTNLNQLQMAQLQVLCAKLFEERWPEVCKYENIKEKK